jgi:hypothetical protein
MNSNTLNLYFSLFEFCIFCSFISTYKITKIHNIYFYYLSLFLYIIFVVFKNLYDTNNVERFLICSSLYHLLFYFNIKITKKHSHFTLCNIWIYFIMFLFLSRYDMNYIQMHEKLHFSCYFMPVLYHL